MASGDRPPSRDPLYRAESAALCRQGAQTACLLAIHLVPLFAILDAVIFADQFGFFLQLRLGAIALLAAVLWLLQRPFGRRHALGLGVVVAITLGLMIDVMTMVTGGETSPYYAGVSLVLLAVALLMPWPPAWSLVTSVVLVGAYALPIVLRGPLRDGGLLVSNLFFLSSSALIAVVSSALRERLRWREFTHRTALVEALRHKDDFMARMSHELRTPIHVMIGYTDILLEEALAAGGVRARRLVERVRDHGLLLHGLISDLLDYAKVAAGKMDVRAEPIAVEALVQELADRFRPLAERKGLAIRAVCREPLPAVVSDRQRLDQILTNLMANAVKFTEQGTVTLEARAAGNGDRTGFTDIATPAPGGAEEQLVILVQDTGIGIRHEDLARLAADFEQVDGAAAKYGGTGLGLSISKKLALRLGGRVAVQSRHGAGSTFALFLPAGVP
jgi:signal transduction histidine kinase